MPNPILEYFRTSKEELEKVSWPSKQDTLRYSTLIIIGSVAAALFFGALDFGLSRLVQAVISGRNPQVQTDPSTPPIPQINPEDIQAVDENGNPVELNINPIPVNPNPAPSNP
ncbi:preprotein translocase subunit SecE [Patescibacteria group bacterium]|nr:preprotein translocase subunit SecE [Patescibacteria group bacterium]MBP9710134.1 preprotein translocase subunit SecE [Patescibacteria group bacterium]